MALAAKNLRAMQQGDLAFFYHSNIGREIVGVRLDPPPAGVDIVDYWMGEQQIRAAGMNPATVSIYIVQDRDPNAFVAGGQNIFVHTGLLPELDRLDTPREQTLLRHRVPLSLSSSGTTFAWRLDP